MIATTQRSRQAAGAFAVCCCLGTLVPAAALGQAPDGVVPITSEPDHKIRVDNGTVRIYEICLSPGMTTLWHEHGADNFTVIFEDSEVTIEPYAGEPVTIPVAAGDAGFSSTASGPYTHRVSASGQTDFHGIAVELLSSDPYGKSTPDRRSDPPFHVALENSRGRAYRVRLEPGETVGPFARTGPAVLVAISAGRISEQAEGSARRLWDFETGHFRWIDEPGVISIRNEGAEPVDLVEIEIY